MLPAPAVQPALHSGTVTPAILCLTASLLSAQQYAISTFAGGTPPITPAAGPSVSIGLPGGIAVDAAGNVFFSSQNCIFRMDRNGVLTRVAGNSRPGYSGDGGLAIDAQLTGPNSVAVDRAGNLYITDNNRVRMISASGIITTVAGNGAPGFSPNAIAVDGAGNIYLADYFNGVRMISTAGIVTTLPVSAQLRATEAIATDQAGNLYIADSSNYRVLKVTPEGVVTTFVSTVTATASDRPDALAFDRNGNLYIASSYNFRVRKVSPGGGITVLYAGDAAPGTEGEVIGFGVDSAGNAYLSDASQHRIRRITANGIVSTATGNGAFSFSGDGGLAIHAQLFGPEAVALDAMGNLYIADRYNGRIRRVSPAGIVTTVAGDGAYGFSGDGGPAINAHFFSPWAVAVDRAGNLYIADSGNSRVRRVSPGGIITTIAGGDISGYSGDGGPATAAQLNGPTSLATDSAGNLYIADGVNNCVRRISIDGIITTVAGIQLTDASGVAVDNSGNLYIADQSGFGRIIKVSPQGIVTALTGAGDIGGPPRTNQTFWPYAVAADASGNVYFTDPYNYRVRKISPNGTIGTIAGGGASGYSGDNGPGAGAQLYNPSGLAVDPAGRLYVADSIENAIRLLTPIPSSISVAAVTNGASNLSGPVAPGEIVVLYGSMLGPATLSLARMTGAAVTFNGTPAPILYTSFTQVAAMVPNNVSGTSAQVSLTWQGQTAPPVSVPLAAAAPGLFTLDSTGQGQAAAINQDGSVNSAAYPAPVGSVVSLYATGIGQLRPVTVTIGGQRLAPEYAGDFAGGGEGLIQVNVRMPSGLTPGTSVPVAVSAGGIASQPGVTLTVGMERSAAAIWTRLH